MTASERRLLRNAFRQWQLCPKCDAPMLPPGVEKKRNEFDHCSGCPYRGLSQEAVETRERERSAAQA